MTGSIQLTALGQLRQPEPVGHGFDYAGFDTASYPLRGEMRDKAMIDGLLMSPCNQQYRRRGPRTILIQRVLDERHIIGDGACRSSGAAMDDPAADKSPADSLGDRSTAPLAADPGFRLLDEIQTRRQLSQLLFRGMIDRAVFSPALFPLIRPRPVRS